MGLTTSGRLQPYGAIVFGDMHTLLGYQQQPPFMWVDHMGGTFRDALTGSESVRVDRVAGVAHAASVFVPFHQTLSGGGVVDGGSFSSIRTDLPTISWVLSGASGSPVVQAFREPTYGNEVMSVHLDGSKNLTTDVAAMAATFTASTWTPPGGSSTSMNEQGFTLFFQRTRFGTVPAATDAEVEITWKVGGATFSAVFGTASPVRLYRGTEEIRSDVARENQPGVAGGWAMGDTGATPYLQVLVVGGRMQIMAPGLGVPVIVHLNRLWNVQIDEVVGSVATVKPGGGDRLPPATFAAKYWPSGQFPTAASRTSVNVTAKSGDDLTLSAGGATSRDQLAVVEPRVTEVSITFTKFTQASFSCHLSRWAPEFAYTSIQQGLGMTPDVSTPFYYDISLPWETRLGLASGDTFSPVDFPNHDITISDAPGISGTELSQYVLSCQSDGTGDFSVGGVLTARYTPAIERVLTRVDGLIDDVDLEGIVEAPINVSPNDIANLFAGWEETLSVDVARMRITQEAVVTMYNHEGIAEFASKTGVNGAGNVACAFRWGWVHQVGISGGEGLGWDGVSTGPGWARWMGYIDTYNYQSSPGSPHSISMPIQTAIAWLDDTPVLAPPVVDGWNHYFAVRWIANYMGIPDSRIGFLDKVPSTPDTVALGDPDAPDGYFLPTGLGTVPWTPIARDLMIGQLLSSIQSLTGYIAYVDAFGVLQYEPFLRAAGGTPKRVFRQVEPYDTKHGLTGIWSMQTTISTRDVRTTIALVGIDAMSPVGSLEPIVYRKEDAAAIDSPVGSQPMNFVGRRKVFAMTDSRFASLQFTKDSGDRLYRIMRLPSITVRFTCYGQPDLYPMDEIVVEDWRSGLTGYPATDANWLKLTIIWMNTKCSAGGGQAIMPVTTIVAVYIPEEPTGDTGGNGIPTTGDPEP